MTNTNAMEQLNIEFKQNANEHGKSRILFYSFIVCFLALVFFRNVIGVGIPVILLLAAFVGFSVFCDRDEMIALFVCCIPLSTVFQYKYAILICLVIYFVKFNKEVRITPAIIPLICLMGWELLHGFGYDFSIVEFLRGFTELILLTFIIMLSNKKFDYTFIFRVFAFCVVGLMVIMLIRLLNQNSWSFEKIFTGSYRFGVSSEEAEEFGMSFNSNGLGGICNLALIGLLQIRMQKKHTKLDVVLMCALVLFGVMTMSRSFLVCFVFICVLAIFCGKHDSITIFKRLVLLIVVIGVLIGLVFLIMPTVVESFLKRFEEEDLSNGRVDLFGYYLDIILNNANVSLFGIGLQNIPDKLETMLGGYFGVPHNSIQELALIWGLPGLVMFGWFIVVMVKNAKNGRKHYNLKNLIPLLFLLLHTQFGHVITSGISLLMLIIVYLSITQSNNTSAKENELRNEK